MAAGGEIVAVPRRPSRLAKLLGRLAVVGLVCGAAIGALIGWSGWRVARAAEGRVFTVADAPARPIAMVLGARADRGRPSSFLAARLDLAVALYRAGKARAILVSGDGRPRSNDEPGVMKAYLVARGVPAEQVVEDPAGFDTYDSCVRARDVFGVRELTLVTQEYHLARALNICRAVGIDAVGVGDVTMKRVFPELYRKGEAREWLANLKMEWDLFSRRRPQEDPFDPSLQEAAER